MKKIFFTGIVSCIIISCAKEKIVNVKEQSENGITQNINLHPTGVKPDDPSWIGKVGYYEASNKSANRIASSVDLSAKMPLIGNQGNQVSCVGWAVGYYCKTYQEVVEKGWDANENAYSPSWIYNQINGGSDQGSTIADAMNLLVYDGCDFKDNFPYSSANFTIQPDAGSKSNSKHYKSSSWQYVQKSTGDIKNLLASSRVVIISIPVHSDFDNLGPHNEIYDDWSGPSRGNHAICLVGYDDNKQAFKFINSWGTGWGLSGYGWIAYSKISSINSAYLLSDKTNLYDTKYLIGDFNGDKRQDVFTTNGYGWYISWSGVSGLKRINTSPKTTGSLKLGDFNGDGKTDVFQTTGDNWQVSYGGATPWKVINGSNENLSNLAFGDFNGDGKTDVFHTSGDNWQISYGGTSAWVIINGSNESLSNLAFGDFNGDGKTDVFHSSGDNWQVSYGGTTLWTVINGSNVGISNLAFGDFNGDGKTDVFHASGDNWQVSYGGTSPWTVINGSNIPLPKLTFGDFNGDGKSDVFNPSTSTWLVSFSGTSPWTTL